ncbi:hypothetical protein AB4Z55_26935 [Gordonia sp. ABKF26]|jgi:hypothetical protein|uniref:hypothetical protein n=1 Tax=Gordonia sp. ABKF26 TaxID=3238687 RepID=UPI0034E4440B
MISEQPTPCAGQPEQWDLDVLVHSPASAHQSLVACLRCPALQACRQDLAVSGVAPRGLIWAADAYGDDGERIPVHALLAYLRRRPRRCESAPSGKPTAGAAA